MEEKEPLGAVGEDLRIPATDGFSLAATLFKAPAARDLGRLVQINSATAVPREIYFKYAAFLASEGITTLVYDYRGIGGSLPGRIKEFDGRMLDWGEKDLAGVIAWVAERFPGHRHLCVCHSVGGQILGLAPNIGRLEGVFAVASQWATYRYWPRFLRWPLRFFYWSHPPVGIALAGFYPGKLFGLGNLPSGIGAEWMRWCNSPHYVCDEAGNPYRPHFGELRAKVRWHAIADDHLLAPEPAVRAMPALYPQASSEVCVLHPREVGAGPIGHFGFFRSRFRDTLWLQSLDWLVEV